MLQTEEPQKTVCKVEEARDKRFNILWFYLHEKSRIDISAETGSRLQVARD